MAKVKSGEFSLNKTAQSFSIPVATLHGRVHGIGETIGSGSNKRLSQQLESILADILIKLSDWGFGRTYNDVITLVIDYLQHQGQSHLFPNGTLGKDWYKLFINRWSHKLSIRAIGNISSLRAASCTQEIVFTRTQIVTGFQNTGLFPLDISKIDQSKLQIANTFETPSSQPEPSSSQPPESIKERTTITTSTRNYTISATAI